MSRIRSISLQAAASFATLAFVALPALADGGAVRFSQTIAPYRITVFTSPTPTRTGEIDISVLVQEAASGKVVRDAIVDLELRRATPADTLYARADRATSTNKLLQSATLEIPSAGLWQVSVEVKATATVSVAFPLTVSPPSENETTLFVGLAFPLLAIGLFLLRERLTQRG